VVNDQKRRGEQTGPGDTASESVPNAGSDGASDALVILDAQGVVVSCSAALETMLGHPRARIVGARLPDFLDLIVTDADLRSRMGALAKGNRASGWPRTVNVVRSDGKAVEVGLSVSAVMLEGRPYRVVVFRDDDEHRRLDAQRKDALDRSVRLRHQLQKNADAFERVVRQDHSGIMIVGESGTVRFANDVAARLLGQSRRSLVGHEFGIPSVLGSTEIDFTYPDRTSGTAEMTSAETLWRGESAYLVMLHDITERKRAEQRGEHAEDQDPLTGLANRALFLERLTAALRRRRRNADYLALVLVGVDRFKVLDDRLGHAVADAVLRAVARRMSGCLPSGNTVAHVGGDKFATILEGLSAAADAQRVIDQIQRAIAAPLDIVSSTLSVGVSVGVAIAPHDGDDAALLLRHADRAMSAHARIDWAQYRTDPS
jgi:diguanylate cyclase (GGDEF)-like protein/PAS domain S-box-containing protein